MKALLLIPIYVICLLTIASFGNAYVNNKPSDIKSFCQDLEPISIMVESSTSLSLNNELDKRLEYKITFCLDQLLIAEDSSQYIISLNSHQSPSFIENYEHLITVKADSIFTHLFKRVE